MRPSPYDSPRYIPVPPTPFPASIENGTTYDSGIMPTYDYEALAVSAQLSQAGSLSIQRYIDEAGTIPMGAAITQAMTADTLATVAVNDGQPALSWKVTIQNTGSAAGDLTDAALLMQGAF